MRTFLFLAPLVALLAAPALAAGEPTIVADTRELALAGRELGETKAYNPVATTVAPAVLVRFANADGYMDGGTAHSIRADDGSFDTGLIPGSSTILFTAPAVVGLYPFHCETHAAMRGVLRVE